MVGRRRQVQPQPHQLLQHLPPGDRDRLVPTKRHGLRSSPPTPRQHCPLRQQQMPRARTPGPSCARAGHADEAAGPASRRRRREEDGRLTTSASPHAWRPRARHVAFSPPPSGAGPPPDRPPRRRSPSPISGSLARSLARSASQPSLRVSTVRYERIRSTLCDDESKRPPLGGPAIRQCRCPVPTEIAERRSARPAPRSVGAASLAQLPAFSRFSDGRPLLDWARRLQ